MDKINLSNIMKNSSNRIHDFQDHNSQDLNPRNLYHQEPEEEEDERTIYDDDQNFNEDPAGFDEDYEEEYRLMVSNRDDFHENGYEGFY